MGLQQQQLGDYVNGLKSVVSKLAWVRQFAGTVVQRPDALPDANVNAFKEWKLERSHAVKVNQDSQPNL